jgi:hypothetical protein
VLNPLRLGLGPIELELHPLVALVAPHVDVRFPLLRAPSAGALRATGLVGLALPTGGFRLAKPLGVRGDLVPSCKVTQAEPERGDSCDEPPWVVVGKLGAMASIGLDVRDGQEWGVLTAKVEVAKGLNVSGDDVLPLDAWAPVNVKLAPALGQFRAELSLAYDQAVLDDLRLRLELAGYYVDRDDTLSPWSTSLHVSADLRTSRHTRVTLGLIWWTADTHERVIDIDAEGFAHAHYIRSNEFWPTLDFLWRY